MDPLHVKIAFFSKTDILYKECWIVELVVDVIFLSL